MNGIDSENIYINIKTTTERLKEKIISKNLIINKVESKSNTKKEQINDLKMTNLFPINSINWTYQNFGSFYTVKKKIIIIKQLLLLYQEIVMEEIIFL